MPMGWPPGTRIHTYIIFFEHKENKTSTVGSRTCQQGWNIRKGEQNRKQEDHTRHKSDRYRP